MLTEEEDTLVCDSDSMKELVKNMVDHNSPDYLEDVNEFAQLVHNIKLLSDELSESTEIKNELEIIFGNMNGPKSETKIDLAILISILFMRQFNKKISNISS
jgi:hypothetical protein